MGDVYEVHDDELDSLVALKVVRPGLLEQEWALMRLKQEVLLARVIAHPNVCRVYDLGRHQDADGALWFLTMELLHGETLSERVRRRGRLTEEEALPLVENIADGLGAAHRAGIMHLDLKSKNVIVVREGDGTERAIVTDFGLARTIASGSEGNSSTGVYVGTPEYMAPEQLRGGEIGPAADLYAFGVVLYEMMTGTLPFTGRTPLEVIRRRLEEEPVSPREVVEGLSERCEQVILRCLSRDIGERYARAEDVTDALAGRSTVEPPSWVQHVLPAERDAFVGREADLDELAARIESGARLVTLLGGAGMGKTRLAVRYGWRSLASWRGSVWFCDLTEARDENRVVSAVARALGVSLGKDDPVSQLGHVIAGRGPCLIIFDNCEQLASRIGELIGLWLERAPNVRFLVTSRERLHVSGEDVQGLEPMSLELGEALFLERARRQAPWDLRGLNLQAVREVVRLTEGMPLAIELAAARMRVMGVEQLAERLKERLRVLAAGGARRHGSLRAAIDTSWELLVPWEQATWAQCAVFEGGFSLEAAEAVLDLGAWPEAPSIMDSVQSLVDKSVLRVWGPAASGGRGAGTEARIGMYASLQEYGREKLRELGAEAERRAEVRHGQWYARYGTHEALAALDKQGGGVDPGRRAEVDIENLLAACRRAVRRGDSETAVAGFRAAFRVLSRRGPYATAVELGKEVAAMPLPRKDLGQVLIELHELQRPLGDLDGARSSVESALAISREIGDRRAEGVALARLGSMHAAQGRMDEARTHLETAIAIQRERGAIDEPAGLEGLAIVHLFQGRKDEARSFFEAALAVARKLGSRVREGAILANLAMVAAEQGQMQEARTRYEEGLAIAREWGNRNTEATVLGNLGNLLYELGLPDEARKHYQAALTIVREIGDRRLEGIVLGNLGAVEHEAGEDGAAQEHMEAGLAIAVEVNNRRSAGYAHGHLGLLHRDQGDLKKARAHFEMALAIACDLRIPHMEGVTLTGFGSLVGDEGRIDEARALFARAEEALREGGESAATALLLCARAALELRAGDRSAGRAAYEAAQTLADEIRAAPGSRLRRELAKLGPT
jgi:predicted ATPase/Tfp pilus assembly protein PilF